MRLCMVAAGDNQFRSLLEQKKWFGDVFGMDSPITEMSSPV